MSDCGAVEETGGSTCDPPIARTESEGCGVEAELPPGSSRKRKEPDAPTMPCPCYLGDAISALQSAELELVKLGDESQADSLAQAKVGEALVMAKAARQSIGRAARELLTTCAETPVRGEASRLVNEILSTLEAPPWHQEGCGKPKEGGECEEGEVEGPSRGCQEPTSCAADTDDEEA
jgi:hypothetical protein